MHIDISPPLYKHLLEEAIKRDLPVKTMIKLILQGKLTIPALSTKH